MAQERTRLIAEISRRGSTSILLVDDEPDVRLSIAEVLMDEGLDVTMAAEGEEAWRNLQRDLRPAPSWQVERRGAHPQDP